MDRLISRRGRDEPARLVGLLAAGRAKDDPVDEAARELRARLEDILGRSGFVRDGTPEHIANVVDLELFAGVLRACGDPDAEVLMSFRSGVPLGWRERLPRAPAAWPRKRRWAPHVGSTAEGDKRCAN